jgi:DNA processing protein
MIKEDRLKVRELPRDPARERGAGTFEAFSPEDLLGPLNEVEKKNAPEQLFVAGDTSLLRRTIPHVSIVGARKASPEGLRRARRLAIELAREGVIIVSGLAEGVDTAAHTGALAAEGRTVAVVGTLLNVFYPAKNRALQETIMREHLAVSPFPVGHPIQKHFPRRNRVMALLSDATVIVEASDSSGSISQGWEAIRLGRDLFIMKSVTEVPGLTWPRAMLRYGAQILTDTRLLLRQLPIEADVALAF